MDEKHSLSVGLFCPEFIQDHSNKIAEEAGFGPNNLTIKAVNESTGEVWWGCSAWWKPSSLIGIFQAPVDDTGEISEHYLEIISKIKVYVRGPEAALFKDAVALYEVTGDYPEPDVTLSLALEQLGLKRVV